LAGLTFCFALDGARCHKNLVVLMSSFTIQLVFRTLIA